MEQGGFYLEFLPVLEELRDKQTDLQTDILLL